MDKQTIYKSSAGYYQIHRDILLKRGYKIIEDNNEYTVFEGPSLAATIQQEVKEEELKCRVTTTS